jgi:hypothetical protein
VNLQELVNKSLKLVNYQKTYLILEFEGQNIRIDFDHKQEFKLTKSSIGNFFIYNDHPLLLDYNEKSATTYINSRPDNPKELSIEIKQAIDSITKG